MQCPQCQRENPRGQKFCGDCGTPLRDVDGSARPAPSYTDLQHSLTEARDQQTATAEILQIISGSPTDLQPVLDAMVERAARLCHSYDAVILRLDAGVLRRAAHHGPIPPLPGFLPLARSRVSGRAVLDREPIQVVDAQAGSADFPEIATYARQQGFRTILSVPLVRKGVALG